MFPPVMPAMYSPGMMLQNFCNFVIFSCYDSWQELTVSHLLRFFGSGTTTTTSAFTIKGEVQNSWRNLIKLFISVTQVRCNSKLKAPDNCLQYFTESTGTLTSFNFAGGTHLANQDYCMCVRCSQHFPEIISHLISQQEREECLHYLLQRHSHNSEQSWSWRSN